MLDEKSKKQLLLILALLPVLVFLVWHNVVMPAVQRHAKSAMALQAPNSIPAVQQADRTTKLVPEVREKLLRGVRTEKWGRDPFFQPNLTPAKPQQLPTLPPPPPPKTVPNFNLAGIVWDVGKPYAIIDDEIRRVGDVIGDFKVVGITESTVTLERNGERTVLRLFADNVW